MATARVIVCGYGPIGRKVVDELRSGNGDFVLIDSDPELLRGVPFPHIVGDATKEDVLKRAGIESSDTIIITTSSDAVNSFIVLVARGLNPEIRILVAVRKVDSIEKLYKAGADQVISESVIGGRMMAKHAISRHIGDFMDRITLTKNIEITEIVIGRKSTLAGVVLKDSEIRQKSGTTVLAIKKKEQLLVNPGASIRLEGGDSIIAIGSGDQIKVLARMARGG